MVFAICSVPVAPMRKTASHRSEMVSQLLFGEVVELFEEEDHFVRVKGLYDGYEGWCQKTQLSYLEGNNLPQTTLYGGNFSNPVLIGGTQTQVPFGVPLYNQSLKFSNSAAPAIDYSSSTKNAINAAERFTHERLKIYAFMFLNTGYLWGGKSVYGIDCSGFVQQVFKLLNIPLLRDAYLQAEQGSAVESIENGVFGDAAFFTNSEGRVTHVGILLSAEKIIHASGSVKIDTITDEGIINKEGEKTHDLYSIRRYI